MNVLFLGILIILLVCLLPNDTNTKNDKNKKENKKRQDEKPNNGTIFIGSKPAKRAFQFLDILKRKIKELIGG